MPDNSITVRFRIKTKEVKEEIEKAVSSVGGFNIQKSSDTEPSDLLIMEIGDNPEIEFRAIEDIKRSGIVREIFLTSGNTDPDVLLRALKIGAREFFTQPVKINEVMDALIKFKEQESPAGTKKAPVKKGKVINVLGSKGGVGTTTVAVNLATNIIGLEGIKSVALIDMGLPFGEVPVFLGIRPASNWTEVVKNISRLDVTYLSSALFKHSSGIQVLASPDKMIYDFKDASQPMESILDLMRTMFDFIVIDSGRFFNPVSMLLLKISDINLLVAVLNLPCLINVKNILSVFRDLGYPKNERSHIILNRFHKKTPISLKEAENSIDRNFLYSIPNDYQLTMSAINQGKSVSLLDSRAEISRSFRDLSQILLGKNEKNKKKKKSVFGLKF